MILSKKSICIWNKIFKDTLLRYPTAKNLFRQPLENLWTIFDRGGRVKCSLDFLRDRFSDRFWLLFT